MDLLVIRHAIAAEREDFGGSGLSDDLRPLTDEGREKMTRNTKGLREIVDRIDVLATSPLVRARETAAIVARAYRIDDVEITDALVPDAAPGALLEWLAPHHDADLVAVVGHEPHLSGLVTWLLCGGDDAVVTLKKGGACFLTFERKPERAGATLQWLLAPRQLGRLAR